jgi:hypothetical protein
MQKLVLILGFLYGAPSFAITFEIVGPCAAKPVYQGNHRASGVSAGRATVDILDKYAVPYRGSEEGIHSILDTPVGDEAIEVINDEEMRVYGWCYEVDGRQPDKMPNEVMLQGEEHLRWFYAFSHYKKGDWLTYCEPAHTAKPRQCFR